MVTASHNPKDDNGFKFAFDEAGNCKGQEIQDFLEFILKGEFSNGEGHVSNYDITNDYIELFKNNINFGKRRIKVVVDPGNGTTAVIVKKIYDLFPMDIVYINDGIMREQVRDEDDVNTPLFFYPIEGILYNLANENFAK